MDWLTPIFERIPRFPSFWPSASATGSASSRSAASASERSESPVAVIGYSSTVAFGHVLLSIGGTILVWMLA